MNIHKGILMRTEFSYQVFDTAAAVGPDNKSTANTAGGNVN